MAMSFLREMDVCTVSKVRIDNGDYLPAKGKGTVDIERYPATKLILGVLLCCKLDRNLLSMRAFEK